MAQQDLLAYQAQSDLLLDKVILVTGAGAGIGRAIAKSYAAHGATVVLLGRTTSKLESVYDEIEQAGHPQPAIYPMNLEGAAPQDYQNLAQKLDEVFSGLHGIVHNAAILSSLTPLQHVDFERYQQVFQVNCHASFLMTQACLGLLKKNQPSVVLFSSDQVAQQSKAYWGAYSAAKAAQDNLMKMWAIEHQTNTQLRFNSIDPGVVATTLRAQAYPLENPQLLAKPEDIMPAYLYLMGKDSAHLNGQILSLHV